MAQGKSGSLVRPRPVRKARRSVAPLAGGFARRTVSTWLEGIGARVEGGEREQKSYFVP